MKFEICVDSVAGVRAALAAGAHRVELCADLFEGGITPSRGTIRQARTVAGIGLHVIVRPRGGDFVFDDDEMAAMLADIETARAEGADGVVIGALAADGRVDAARTRALMAAAGPLSVTFHRAFDMTPDPVEALETLVELGVQRILTSGQEATVLEGLPLVADLVRRAGERVIVMPGGGITERNVARIVAEARPKEIHFAALQAAESPATLRRPHVFMGGELRQSEWSRLETSTRWSAPCWRRPADDEPRRAPFALGSPATIGIESISRDVNTALRGGHCNTPSCVRRAARRRICRRCGRGLREAGAVPAASCVARSRGTRGAIRGGTADRPGGAAEGSLAMFFFDFIDGDYTTRDVDGCDLQDAEAARSEVLRALVAVFSNEPRDAADHREVVCSVRDDSGTIVYRGVLTLSGTPFPNS